MFAFIENAEMSKCDSHVQTLSWMGKTPDNPPEGGSWRLNEASYYHHGWLASGNARGIIGVTFTSCQSVVPDQPARTNFYLRGHRSEVVLVKWNEPYQKLATCDITGIIFVWIKHDGRWSIELINDRSSQVTDFSWSHDGQMALICYKDSFVLVGSVAGQRYWSSMLNLEGCTVTCGIWSPDDQKVMFGTTAGKVIVMSAGGTMIAQVVIHADLEITHLGWSAERFHLIEQTNNNKSTQTDNNRPPNNNNNDSDDQTNMSKPHILSVVLSVGDILLMTGYDDLCPRVIHTGLKGVRVEWSNDGGTLAVVGYKNISDLPDVVNELRFYNRSFKLQLSIKIPATQVKQGVTAMTWGHNDQRLFVAVGCEIFTVWVYKSIASLQLLCKAALHHYLADDMRLYKLPLPSKLLGNVADMFSPTIKGYIPHPKRLREYVCTSPPWKDRLHCTIIRHGDESSGGCYVLYLEHLGGLIPLLKGKRASKLHPDFVIFDPQGDMSFKKEDEMISSYHSASATLNVDSALEDSDSDAREGSPSIRKKKKFLKLRESLKCRESAASSSADQNSYEPTFDDILPESRHLVSITSNIWGTKFRFVGMSPFLPEELGTVTYKTSLLHLQPRQMTVGIVELPRDAHFYNNLGSVDTISNDCISNQCPYLEADDELYANYFYDIENLDQNSGCLAAVSSDNGSDNLVAQISSHFVEASSSSSFSATSSLEDASSNIKESSKSNVISQLDPCVVPFLKNSFPTRPTLPQNVHLSSLQAQLNERIARVSPTEVDPFLEFCVRDRLYHMSDAFVPVDCVREVIGSTVDDTKESIGCEDIDLSTQEALETKDETSCNKIISSISDVTLVSSETLIPEISVTAQVESQPDNQSEDSQVEIRKSSVDEEQQVTSCKSSVPGVSLQYIDDDCDLTIDLYERQCQFKKGLNTDHSNLSARAVMIQSSVEVRSHESPVKIVTQNADTKHSRELLTGDSLTYSPSKNIIMKPLVCGKAAISSSSGMDFDSIHSICSFEPCKTRLVLTPGGPINSLTPEQTPSKSARSSVGSISKSRLKELARNALCRGNSNTGTTSCGSNVPCGQHASRSKRRFFNGLCGISEPRGGNNTSSNNRQSAEEAPRSSDSSGPSSPVRNQQRAHQHRCGSLDVRTCDPLSSLSSSFHLTNHNTLMPSTSRASCHHMSASLPSSPIHKQLTTSHQSSRPKQNQLLSTTPGSASHSSRLAGRSQLQSPLLLSRRRINGCNQGVESSDDERVVSSEDVTTSENYQNLETFQKARLHKKVARQLKKVRSKTGETEGTMENASHPGSPSVSPQHRQPLSPRRHTSQPYSAPTSTSRKNSNKSKPLRHFVMHNKAPMWNDSSQVYQLDFGGRVTQESAKNFQIEFGGKQVMQFGRIDNNAYTLDFQYPYSATQAFAVALANVTQRLK